MAFIFFMTFLLQSWDVSVDAGLNLSQSYYNDAWSGDELGSIVWVGLLNAEAKKALTEKMFFTNTSHLAYGQTYMQDSTGNWSDPLKSTDKIENESVLRFTMGWLVDPFASFLLKTQFYDEPNAMYVNPIEMTEALGVAKTFAKTENQEINTRAGLAFKHSIDRAVSIDMPIEGGLEVVVDGMKKISETAQYNGKLTVFKALFNSESDTTDTWKTPDIDFQNTVSVSLTKYLQMSFYLELVYDKDIIDDIQIKENFAIGLTYKLF